MSFLFKFNLISHVFLGLLGIIFFYAVLMILSKQVDERRLKFLKLYSLGGFISFVLSWITGGYYYLYYYGAKVKPIIKAGKYAWAHGIMMETKEHIFLFLPFAALVVALLFYLFGSSLEQNSHAPEQSSVRGAAKIKNSLIALSAIIVVIGTIIALMGMIVSGAVR